MQQNSQIKNTILFVVLMALCLGVWALMRYYVFPPPPPPPPPPPTVPGEVYQAAAALSSSDGGLAQGLGQAALLAQTQPKSAEAKPEPAKPVAPAAPPVVHQPAPLDKLITLGEKDRKSKYHVYAKLDSYGAAVRLVILNKFQQADYLGRPETEPDGSPRPLTLVPDDADNPSNLLLAYTVNDTTAEGKPLDTLGRVEWAATTPDAETLPDGRVRQSVVFTSPPLKELQGFRVTKTYSLTQGDYHLGLEVKVKRMPTATLDDKAVTFRYQMTGFHGLPLEGRWYTRYFRSALTGQVDRYKNVARDYQDMRQMAGWDGGNLVDRQPDYVIRYAGIAVQYFASVIVVDDKQNEGQKQDFLARARPTLERAVVKGVVTGVNPGEDKTLTTFTLKRADNSQDMTFRVRKEDEAACADLLKQNASVAVLYTTGSYDGKEYPEYARALLNDAETQSLWEDDATVRVSTEPAEFKPNDEVVHKYLLYNGPVKVMLLDQPEPGTPPDERVRTELVNRYLSDLSLNTLADAPAPGWVGSVTGPTGVARVLILITNVMHYILWCLHYYLYIPYILCIVLLTVGVRAAMFPVSRKQQMTSIRMQALAPEMKKLQEKHKDDKQALAAAQMELYRRHGVNPFGTCWMLLIQMPIFMGLYYALMESIHFRLAPLWPGLWWLPNLSAPDMLVYWTNYIPFISQPAYYEWLTYLGPYLNVLPIIAVAFMIVQQKWTMPPPTDDQQAQQQKMMKYMMIFMGVMFYKVASGLCIYFIASSLWGFAERKFFLPKKKAGDLPPPEEKPREGIMARLLAKAGNGSGVTTGPAAGVAAKGKRGKRRQEAGRPRAKDDGDGWMLQRLRDWWEDILEQARKK